MYDNNQNFNGLPYEVGEFNMQRYDNMSTLESNVLGFCLTQKLPYYWEKILPRFRAEEFVNPYHQTMWQAACALQAEDIPLDVVNIADRLEQLYEGKDVQVFDPHTGQQETLSVRRLLMQTMDLAIMSEEAWENAVSSLRRYMDAQSLFVLAEEMKKRLLQCDDLNDIMADAEKAIADLGADNADDVVNSVRLGADLYAFLDSKTVYSIPTGFKDLDYLLGGGLLNSGLYILAARPGVGKTTFGLQIADHVAAHVGSVLFVTLEMDKEQIEARRIARMASIPATKILTNQLDQNDWTRIATHMSRTAKIKFYANNRLHCTVSEVRGMARHVPDLRLVVVDYLGLLRSDAKNFSQYEKITAISGELKTLARALHVPVLCLAQLNRMSELRQDKSPSLADLRDSGAIEQDADGVILLHRDDLYQKDPPDESKPVLVSGHLAKNRHGKMGRFEVALDLACGRLYDVQHFSN